MINQQQNFNSTQIKTPIIENKYCSYALFQFPDNEKYYGKQITGNNKRFDSNDQNQHIFHQNSNPNNIKNRQLNLQTHSYNINNTNPNYHTNLNPSIRFNNNQEDDDESEMNFFNNNQHFRHTMNNNQFNRFQRTNNSNETFNNHGQFNSSHFRFNNNQVDDDESEINFSNNNQHFRRTTNNNQFNRFQYTQNSNQTLNNYEQLNHSQIIKKQINNVLEQKNETRIQSLEEQNIERKLGQKTNKPIPKLKIIEVSNLRLKYQKYQQIERQVVIMTDFEFKETPKQNIKKQDLFEQYLSFRNQIYKPQDNELYESPKQTNLKMHDLIEQLEFKPNQKEEDIIYSVYLNDLSDFSTKQDITQRKTFFLNIKNSKYSKLEIMDIISEFILDNIKLFDSLNLEMDVQSLFGILRLISSSKEKILVPNIKQVCLRFQPLKLKHQDQFIENENKLNDNSFIQKFFQKIQGITTLKLYFAQYQLQNNTLQSICEVIESQAQLNQLQTLAICLSQSRIDFDLLEIFQSVQKIKSLKKFELDLKFSTQFTISKPKENILQLQIEDIDLNLACCPCSHQILEYISFNNLHKLKINLSHVKNKQSHIENITNLQKWIKENTKIEFIKIDLSHSVQIEDKYYQQMIYETINSKNTLKDIELIGFPFTFMTEKSLEFLQQIQYCLISVENKPYVKIQNKKLSIAYDQEQQYSFDLRILSILLEHTKGSINKLYLRGIIDIQNEKMNILQRSLQAVKLIRACKQLISVELVLYDNEIFTNQVVDNYLQIMDELTYLYEFSLSYKQKYKVYSKQTQKLSDILQKNCCLQDIRLNKYNYFDKVIQSRKCFFHRVVKCLQLVKKCNLKKIFRQDIVNEIIKYGYNDQDN